MGRYILKRCTSLIFVLIGSAILIFSIMHIIPGNAADALLGPSATAIEKQALLNKLGLNEPFVVQLFKYLYHVFIQFDFGNSYAYNTPVIHELMSRIPRTLFLGTSCVVLNSVLGIPLGIAAGLHRGKWQDFASMIISLLFVSIPSFWLAIELVVIFSVNLGWLPAFGIGGFEYYIMPIIAASMSGVAINARQMRSSILEVIRADYIDTARAKGVDEKTVIRRHMLPNAMIPIVTSLGVGLGKSIAGVIVIEAIFTLPGVGMYLMTGINMKDYPVVQGSIIVLSFFTAVVMLLVDLVYALIDPRIKAQYSGQLKKAKA